MLPIRVRLRMLPMGCILHLLPMSVKSVVDGSIGTGPPGQRRPAPHCRNGLEVTVGTGVWSRSDSIVRCTSSRPGLRPAAIVRTAAGTVAVVRRSPRPAR